MAHEIDMSNKRANMAYVGENPWHGLGQQLTKGAPLETWKKQAGMDWNIKSSPVLFSTESIQGVQQGKIAMPNQFTNKRVLYRSDNESALSVVSNNYKVVQPGEILEFFRDLVSVGGMELETAGCLFGGTRYWALANTGREDDVVKNDRVKGMLLLTTSCDGTLATTAKFTSVRVVCNNTLRISLADEESANSAIRISHGAVFDPKKIKESLGLLDLGWDKFMNDIRRMSKMKLSDSDAKKFFSDIILTNEQKAAFEKEEAVHARVQSKLDLIYGKFNGNGMGADMAKGTVWGALNAITEFADHNVGKVADNKLWNSWFGYGETIKNKAFEAAKELVY